MGSLSSSGLAVVLDSFLPLGKHAGVDFKIGDSLDFKNISAKVIRIRDLEDKFVVGLEFIDISKDDVSRIKELIQSIFFIKEIKLFANISHDEALYLKTVGSEKEYKEGEVLFTEGEDGDAFYAVISGKVRITKRSQIEGGNEEILALIRENEFFGEMALFDEGERTANAQAHSDSRLFVVTAENFNEIIKNNHILAIKILVGFIRTLSRRLKNMNQEMVDLLFSDSVIKDMNQGGKT